LVEMVKWSKVFYIQQHPNSSSDWDMPPCKQTPFSTTVVDNMCNYYDKPCKYKLTSIPPEGEHM